MARIAEALPCVVAATIPNADPADISPSPYKYIDIRIEYRKFIP